MSAPLVLQSIKIKNFGGYYGETTANFPTGVRNVMAVEGRNTGGKTSFINALKWCFYGEVGTRADIHMPLTSLFNTVGVATGETEMSIEIDALVHGERLLFVRRATRKHPNTPPSSDNDFSINFAIHKDGQVLSEDQSRRKINRVAPQIISRFFLFDGELLKEYEDLIEKRNHKSNYALVEAIEDVLGLPALKTATKFANKALSMAERNVAQRAKSGNQSNNLAAQLENKRGYRDQEAESLNESEARLEEVELEKSDLENQVMKEKELNELRGQMKNNDEQRTRLKKTLRDLQNDLALMTANAWKDGVYLALVKQEKLVNKEREELLQAQTESVVEQHDLNALKDILSEGHCGTCGQDVSSDRLAQIKAKVDEIAKTQSDRQAHTQVMEEKTYQHQSIRRLMAKSKPIYADYSALIKRVAETDSELLRADNEHDLMVAETRNEDLEAVRKRRLKLEQLTEEAGVLKDKINTSKAKIDDYDRDITKLIESIEAADGSDEVGAATEVKQKIEKIKKVFQTGREELREEMRKHVQDYASRSYKAMIHEEDHQEVQIQKDNYELTIVDRHGRTVKEPSSGATQVLALALIVALGKAGRPIGPIVMDSPFGRLDESHRSRVLRYLTRQSNQLVLLYHSGELQPATLQKVQDRIGCRYRIDKKEEGRSRLVESEV